MALVSLGPKRIALINDLVGRGLQSENSSNTAPFIRGPTLLTAGRNDEMVHCNPDVTRAVFGLMRCRKEWADIDGGHFGLLCHPSAIFEQASAGQCAFLIEALGAQITQRSQPT
jgi:hypothetical protein